MYHPALPTIEWAHHPQLKPTARCDGKHLARWELFGVPHGAGVSSPNRRKLANAYTPEDTAVGPSGRAAAVPQPQPRAYRSVPSVGI